MYSYVGFYVVKTPSDSHQVKVVLYRRGGTTTMAAIIVLGDNINNHSPNFTAVVVTSTQEWQGQSQVLALIPTEQPSLMF
jgi:hypothetical protein